MNGLDIAQVLLGLARTGVDIYDRVHAATGKDLRTMTDAEALPVIRAISIRQPAELIAEGQRQVEDGA